MKSIPFLLIFYGLALLNLDASYSPLIDNSYLECSLQPYLNLKKSSDPFDRTFVLPKKSRANYVIGNALLVTSAIVLINPEARRKFKQRWQLITSPNHSSPLNQGPFHFKTLEQEKSQNTQADKGVHFFYHYLPVKPVSFLCEYIIDGLPFVSHNGRDSEDWVSDEAYYLATALVFAGGFFEEFVDGKEKDEGFSILDLIANSSGSIYALLKHKGLFKNLYIYWSFSSPPEHWKWHSWDYMPGYEFRAVVDISSLIFKEQRPIPPLFKWWTDTAAYIPDIQEFGTSSPQKKAANTAIP